MDIKESGIRDWGNNLFADIDALIFIVLRRATHIVPGRYGYGKAPYVASLQRDKGQSPGRDYPHRQRRSAAAHAHHPGTGGQGGPRSNNLDPSSGAHPYNRPYTQRRAQQPKYNPVWAPLYQPGSTNQAPDQQEVPSGSRTFEEQHQERPYNPLPTSFCRGEHSHYRICSNDVCTFAHFHYCFLQELPGTLIFFIFLLFAIEAFKILKLYVAAQRSKHNLAFAWFITFLVLFHNVRGNKKVVRFLLSFSSRTLQKEIFPFSLDT